MAHPPRRSKTVLWSALVALTTATCVGVPADEGLSQSTQEITSCAPREPEPTRQLRQLSLDLRGAPPTVDELEAVKRAGRVTPEMIDAMLRSDAFVGEASRWHADLLWPNLDGFLIRPGGLRQTRGGNNPELSVDLLDARTNEATCPRTGNGAITAASCCTTDRAHPACCLVNNRAYTASDPACTAKSAALPALYTVGSGIGDRTLRGGSGSTGCDDALEYPPPRVAATDRRWTHDASGRPYYTSPRSGRTRFYYDADDVPLPYDDWTHCPNYCRRETATDPSGTFTLVDFAAKVRTEGTATVNGDGPTARCPAGFPIEVQNTCDNVMANPPEVGLRVRREGYRLMTTYWSQGHVVKVCAYEAQDRTNSVYTGQACNPAARVEASCGCGPDGVYCLPSQGYQSALPTRAERRIREALNEEPLRIVASVIARDEDYYNAFTTRRSFLTGALATMYRQQADRLTGLSVSPPAQPAAMPDMGYEDDTWHEYVRGPEHSGVLTTAAFLGRFPTWRSRINRFRSAVLCRPFVPPDVALPPSDDACNREPNLAHRCGCQHCHASIEPLGAYWGRWAERSAVYLDPTNFPSFDPNCATCATTGQFCTTRCRNNYVTATLDADGSRYAGTLFGYLYRSDEEARRVDAGPAALVASGLSSGEMQSCSVNTLWRRLVGRPMNDQETDEVLPSLVQGFEASHHNYRALVRAIVTAPAYRRID